MTHNMAELFALHEHDHYGVHRRHLNEQMVRVLKAIGCDVASAVAKASISMIEMAIVISTY
jgi:hypothetical protein